MDLGDKTFITNPTLYEVGKAMVCLGLIGLTIGVITYFIGDLIIPDECWGVFGILLMVIGVIIGSCGIRKR